jgi:hypothetical protein
MSKHGDQRALVHRQIDMRASVFAYLYRCWNIGEDPDRACEAEHRVWQPTRQWREPISDLHTARGLPLPSLSNRRRRTPAHADARQGLRAGQG